MQKSLYFLLFIFFTQQMSAQSISIQEAAAQKKILYKLSGSWKNNKEKEKYLDADGQYFGKCMKINIHSISKDTLYLDIDNGLMLMCEDTTVQDMIVTKSVHIDLLPGETQSFRLYAMCTEIKDGMPEDIRVYKIGNLADDKLRAITVTIENKYMQNVIGQGAVWAYTDHATESDLRRYGATQYTLAMTGELLTQSGTMTPFTKTQDSLDQALIIPLSENETSEGMLNPTITLDLYVFYGATGVFLILLSITVYLAFKKRKKKDTDLIQ